MCSGVKGQPGASEAVRELKEDPEDPKAQQTLGNLLVATLAQDPELLAAAAELWEQAKAKGATGIPLVFPSRAGDFTFYLLDKAFRRAQRKRPPADFHSGEGKTTLLMRLARKRPRPSWPNWQRPTNWGAWLNSPLGLERIRDRPDGDFLLRGYARIAAVHRFDLWIERNLVAKALNIPPAEINPRAARRFPIRPHALSAGRPGRSPQRPRLSSVGPDGERAGDPVRAL